MINRVGSTTSICVSTTYTIINDRYDEINALYVFTADIAKEMYEG
jgi:hypothetical protein